jgi:intracellular septation protein A
MHLLKEVYFHVNSLEFLLISVFLVIGILVLYFLLNFILKYELMGANYLNKNFKLKNKNNSFFFFKIQNFNKQINTSASSRVWVKFKNDTKTDNTISNR